MEQLSNPIVSVFGIISIFNVLIFLGMLALTIYIMVLVIKVARRGIKALDIYIEKNKDRMNY